MLLSRSLPGSQGVGRTDLHETPVGRGPNCLASCQAEAALSL